MHEGFMRVVSPDEVTANEENEENPQELAAIDSFAASLQAQWESYRDARREIENEWLDAIRAMKGEYTPEQKKVMDERGSLSEIYVRITSTKTNTAYSRIVDLMFQNVDGFWDVSPSPIKEIPRAIREALYQNAMEAALSYPDAPGQLRAQYADQMYKQMEQEVLAKAMQETEESAQKMKRQIKDDLIDTDALTKIKHTTRECCVLGTGCYKMATVKIKENEQWQEGDDGWQINTTRAVAPEIETVSVFEMFPDPWSLDIGKPNDLFRRHVLNRGDMRALLDNPLFDAEKIEKLLLDKPDGNHVDLDYEKELRSINDNDEIMSKSKLFDVLEYWGMCDGAKLMDYGIEVDDPMQEYQANIWISEGQVIASRLNPLRPEAIPYRFVPYEQVLHRFWGLGIPAMMKDAQDVMNATARALCDNAALTAAPLFQMDVSMLPEGTSIEEAREIHPFKVWLYNSSQGHGKTLLQEMNIQSNQKELAAIFELFRRFADEETSLPSYTHGETSQSLNSTATGMSMLMTAANVALKSVVKNLDDYMIKPLIRSLYDFTMRWSDKDDIKQSDLDVVPMGATALVAKELQSQRMMQAMQMSMNPAMAPLVDYRYLLQEYFKSLDIDPEKALHEQEEVNAINALNQGGGAGIGGAPVEPGLPGDQGLPLQEGQGDNRQFGI